MCAPEVANTGRHFSNSALSPPTIPGGAGDAGAQTSKLLERLLAQIIDHEVKPSPGHVHSHGLTDVPEPDETNPRCHGSSLLYGMRNAECGIKHSLSGLHSRLFDIPQSSFRIRLETALREHERPSLTHCETLSVLGARSTTGTAAPSQAPPGAVALPRPPWQ